MASRAELKKPKILKKWDTFVTQMRNEGANHKFRILHRKNEQNNYRLLLS